MNRYLTVLTSVVFMLIFGTATFAQNLEPNLTTPTPNIGRLFLSEAERSVIDKDRERGGDENNSEPQTAGEPVKDIPMKNEVEKASFTLSGVLFRADGETVIWINGKSDLSKDKPAIQLDSGRVDRDSNEIPLRQGSDKITLKPGQVWLPKENRAVESYNLNTDSTGSEKAMP